MPRQRQASPINFIVVLVAITLGLVVGIYMFLPRGEEAPPVGVDPVAETVEEPTIPQETPEEPTPQPEVAMEVIEPTPAPAAATPKPTPEASPSPLPIQVVEPTDSTAAPEVEEAIEAPQVADQAEEFYPDWLLGEEGDETAAPPMDFDLAEELPAVALPDEEPTETPVELVEIVDEPETVELAETVLEPELISGTVDSDDPVRFSGTIRNHRGEVVPRGELFVIAQGDGALAEKVRRAFASSHTHTIVRANSQGRFEFKIPPGKVFLAGPLIAGEPQASVLEIGPELPGAVVETDFELPRPFVLRGAVTNRAGLRLEGIPVQISWTPSTLRGRQPEARTVDVVSDSEGYFEVALPKVTRATLDIDSTRLPEPYLYDSPPRVVTREDFQTNRYYRVTMVVITGVTMEGRVVRSGDQVEPVLGARVELTPVGEMGLQVDRRQTVISDRDGRFQFDTLYPRRYLVTASMEGYNQAILRDFLPETGVPVDLVLQPLAAVGGTIELPEALDEPARGQVNLLGRRGGSFRQALEFRAGESQAQWSFEGIPSGSYLLAVQLEESSGREWYQEKRVVVINGMIEEPSHTVLQPLGRVSGRFTTSIPGGGSYTDLVVSMASGGEDLETLFPPTFQQEFRRRPGSRVMEDGTFELFDLLAQTEYRARVHKKGSNLLLGGTLINLEGQELREGLEVSLEGTGRITGFVFNDRREACSGTRVVLSAGLGTMEGMAAGIQRRTTEVRFDGSFSFDAVPVGNARVALEGDDTRGRLIYIPFNQEVTVELACRTWVDVEFALTARDRPIGEREHFLVIAQPGTVVRDTVREIFYEDLRLRLEPGRYVITRTSTMESQPFEVVPRLDGTIAITYGAQQ